MVRLKVLALAVAGIVFAFGVPQAHSYSVNVDQVIWQPDSGFDGSDLSATVDFEGGPGTSNTFEIILTNTSGNLTYDQFSSVLLTGLGFNLPSGYSIVGGDIDSPPTTASNGADLNGKWGYDNNPLDSGPFKDVTTLSVDTVISTMESATEKTSALVFSPSSSTDYQFQGPNYGIMDTEQASPGGLPYIIGAAQITVNLNKAVSDWSTFFKDINDADVVASFGSPTAVPEPVTMILLGIGLIGLVSFRRKFLKN